MDIKITHTLLSQFLKTAATPAEIAEKLSLCGPTVDRLTQTETGDRIYEIEVITNRVDAASAFGIAREAVAILPEFNLPAELTNDPRTVNFPKTDRQNLPAKVTVDPKLAPRFACIALENISIKPSPQSTINILNSCGERSLNNVIDISNELTLKYGQPVHIFDLDRIKGRQMLLRLSQKGEKITTLDGQTHTLPGDDIVIEDGAGRLIDLCGIMGGDLSAVTDSTKNVLLFVQTYDPKRIRKTSLTLQKRTLAAQLFEKRPDPEMVLPVLIQGIKLLEARAGAKISSSLIDLYPSPAKPKKVTLSLDWLARFSGINLEAKHIAKILNRLEIEVTTSNKSEFTCIIPSHRLQDLSTKEDLAEEIMRVYGYFRLPSIIPQTDLPSIPTNPRLNWESKLRQLLVNYGATEIYTYSLVSQALIGSDQKSAFKLANPLSEDYLYMRQRLLPSLMAAKKENKGSYDKPYVLFEIANVYTKNKKTGLADEIPHLALLWNQTDYRHAKGFVDTLATRLNLPAGALSLKPIDDTFGLEVDLNQLFKQTDFIHHFQPVPTAQAIIEDLTFTLTKQNFETIAATIRAISPLIESIGLKDIYQNNYTFTLTYRHPNRTLSSPEIAPIRKEIVAKLAKQGIKLVGTV